MKDENFEVHTSCGICGQDIYKGEGYWRINGTNICEDCFPAFARRYFKPFRIMGDEQDE